MRYSLLYVLPSDYSKPHLSATRCVILDELKSDIHARLRESEGLQDRNHRMEPSRLLVIPLGNEQV